MHFHRHLTHFIRPFTPSHRPLTSLGRHLPFLLAYRCLRITLHRPPSVINILKMLFNASFLSSNASLPALTRAHFNVPSSPLNAYLLPFSESSLPFNTSSLPYNASPSSLSSSAFLLFCQKMPPGRRMLFNVSSSPFNACLLPFTVSSLPFNTSSLPFYTSSLPFNPF